MHAAKWLLLCMGVCMILGTFMQWQTSAPAGRANSLIKHLNGRKMLIAMSSGKMQFTRPTKGGAILGSSKVEDANLRLVPSGPDPLHHSRKPNKPRNTP